MSRKLLSYLSICIFFLSVSLAGTEPKNPESDVSTRFGFTIHFNNLRSVADAKKTVAMALSAGATVVNIVPPAHIWSNPTCVQMLDTLFAETQIKGMEVILNRIDANYPDGTNYLYSQVLSQPGKLPLGATALRRIYATVGNPAYEEWLQQETEYYATHYGKQPNLIGFTIGGFAELFDSPHGSILVWSNKTKKYEIGQYTEAMGKFWQQWLLTKFETIDRVNAEYGTTFTKFDEVPLPINESDKRFRSASRAYFDFITVINDWWKKQYAYNKAIWQKSSQAPFILQLNGTLLDKLINGRPGYTAFDLPGWLSSADAIGLSLYTDSQLPDLGLGSLFASVNIMQWAKELGKPIFVLESGIERPKAELDLFQLRYIAELAIPLNPRSYIYEYLRYTKRDKSIPPGMVFTADWKLNQPTSTSIRQAYQRTDRYLSEKQEVPVAPYLYVIMAPKTIRDDVLAAKFNAMLYATATFVPLRLVDINDIAFIPAKQMVLLAPTWKTELPEAYQTKILQLAKRRSWMLMSDEHTYPLIQRQLGKEVAGATLDLAGYLKEVKPDVAGLGFGKAIVNFYLTQTNNPPNGFTAQPGLAFVPLLNGIHIFCDQPVEMIPLDSAAWNLTEKDKNEFHIAVYRLDVQPTMIQVTIPVVPRGTLKTVRWTVTETGGGKKVRVPVKTIKNNIEFTAKHGVDYVVSLAKPKT